MVMQLRPIHLVDLASTPVLLAYLWGGLLALLVEPPSVVENQLGPVFGMIWAVMLVVGSILAASAFPMADQWAGTWLRLGSGLILFGAIGTFTMCMGHAYGPTAFEVIVPGGLASDALLGVMVDVRKLQLIRRHAQEMP